MKKLGRADQKRAYQNHDLLSGTVVLMLVVVIITILLMFGFYLYTLNSMEQQVLQKNTLLENRPAQQATGTVTLQIIPPPPEEQAFYENR